MIIKKNVPGWRVAYSGSLLESSGVFFHAMIQVILGAGKHQTKHVKRSSKEDKFEAICNLGFISLFLVDHEEGSL